MFHTTSARLGIAVLACFCLVDPVLAAPEAADTVTAFHASLSETMQHGAKLGCDGRIAALTPAVDKAFDLPFIAERVLRRHWKALDAAEQARFTAELRTSVITTYATEFARADTVRFATDKTDALSNGDAVVHTKLMPAASADAVELDYILKPREGWKVVNVLAEGVSDLALRATQYDGVMKSSGLPALLEKLQDQTKALRTRCK